MSIQNVLDYIRKAPRLIQEFSLGRDISNYIYAIKRDEDQFFSLSNERAQLQKALGLAALGAGSLSIALATLSQIYALHPTARIWNSLSQMKFALCTALAGAWSLDKVSRLAYLLTKIKAQGRNFFTAFIPTETKSFREKVHFMTREDKIYHSCIALSILATAIIYRLCSYFFLLPEAPAPLSNLLLTSFRVTAGLLATYSLSKLAETFFWEKPKSKATPLPPRATPAPQITPLAAPKSNFTSPAYLQKFEGTYQEDGLTKEIIAADQHLILKSQFGDSVLQPSNVENEFVMQNNNQIVRFLLDERGGAGQFEIIRTSLNVAERTVLSTSDRTGPLTKIPRSRAKRALPGRPGSPSFLQNFVGAYTLSYLVFSFTASITVSKKCLVITLPENIRSFLPQNLKRSHPENLSLTLCLTDNPNEFRVESEDQFRVIFEQNEDGVVDRATINVPQIGAISAMRSL